MRPLVERVWYGVDMMSIPQPQPHMLITYSQLLESLISLAKHHPDKLNAPLVIEVDGERFVTYDPVHVGADHLPIIVVQTMEE